MSTTSIPKTMKALITQPDKTVAVQEIPVPTISDSEILVKTVAVAQNPTDWQYVDRVTNAGTISGCDWSGYVVAIGKYVTTPSVGDHVAGFVQGGTYKDRGAFAEYVKTDADLAWKVPSGTLSHEEAATMGCAFWTAVQGLFHPTRLGLVEPPSKVSKEEWVFVYGGSSSVGMYAIQLAHHAGYKVATAASPKNHEICESYGADVVFDYRDPDAVTRIIKDTTKNSLRYAFDTISQVDTQKLTVQTLGSSGGEVIVILGPSSDAQKLREDVKVQFTLIYTSLGREFKLGGHYPPSPEDRSHMAQFLQKVPQLVSSGAIKPNKVKLWEGGLYAIPDGLQFMRESKHSGEKIVYRI
ncbi:uncharacterized protein FIBRA_00239 [Fibroporia radiculosa]|uniref:Enoyl reductase (ER) domain-containing protein n=1 Tax=Fibroporia radiculosa TaxID=599839 RepID=J7RV80_9APHY|nr:uncharacterized protein FIBRA_00239 [Fibroporia radiculosa]CCL98245.1 predicted protein [Fibroporia radiculosa]